MRTRGIVVAAVAVVLAAGVVGGVVAGGFDWSRSSEGLRVAIASEEPIQVADIPAADGLPARGVFARLTSTGHLCLSDGALDAPLAGGGGCNAAADPLGGAPLSASLSYEGGPALETVRDARLIGLAADGVASLRIAMSDGSSRAVRLKPASVASRQLQVFGFRVRKSDLRKGVGPVAVVAYDANGVELGRQPTGIG